MGKIEVDDRTIDNRTDKERKHSDRLKADLKHIWPGVQQLQEALELATVMAMAGPPLLDYSREDTLRILAMIYHNAYYTVIEQLQEDYNITYTMVRDIDFEPGDDPEEE